MDGRENALAEIAKHCDVQDRLLVLPPSALCRGLYFRSIENVLAEAGRADAYRALFPERFSALGWYSMHDFIERLVIGAGFLLGPERVHEGMFEIGRRNARAFSEGVLGRLMLRLLSKEPRKVLKQAIAGRRQSAKPARWELSFPEERSAVMSMVEEYLYLDHYLLGAARGTFEMIDVPVRIECVLEDRFSGKHVFRW